MVHELIQWSSTPEQCDIQKFVEKYGHHLPLLIRIAEGYAGRDEYMHLFAQNEVSQSVCLTSACSCCILAAFRIYSVSQKNNNLTFDHNFAKCRPIYKIFSLSDF